jgi:hypothetical protein
MEVDSGSNQLKTKVPAVKVHSDEAVALEAKNRELLEYISILEGKVNAMTLEKLNNTIVR